MNLRRRSATLLVLCMSLAGCIDDKPAERIGYFKSDDPHRVLSFYAPDPLTEEQASAVFDGLPNTPGRMTQAVIYSGPRENAIADDLTNAQTLGNALALISNPPFDRWDWRYIIAPSGVSTIYQGSRE